MKLPWDRPMWPFISNLGILWVIEYQVKEEGGNLSFNKRV